jgi:hypothetical protein
MSEVFKWKLSIIFTNAIDAQTKKGKFCIIESITIFIIDIVLWMKHDNWYEFFLYYKKKITCITQNKKTRRKSS